jgi:hypothetical protein
MAVKKPIPPNKIVPVRYIFEGSRFSFQLNRISHKAIGSRIIRRGVANPGNNHFLNAPSKINKIR